MRDKILALRALLRSPGFWLAAAGLACFLWAYANTFAALAERWTNSAQYSHGFLVPLFALAVLWRRYDLLKEKKADLRPSAWGVSLILLGGALRLAGAYWYYPWLDSLSLLPALAGLVVLLGGWRALVLAWPAVAFLLFMLPLPYFVEGALARPLQRVATIASTYALQTLGLPAVAEGNIIVLGAQKIGVQEACNGLGMLVLFFAVCTAIALWLKDVKHWERVVLVASAVPIALVANVARIVVTGVLTETISPEVGHKVFHDYAGWLMMPLALGLAWLEWQLLGWLLVKPAEGQAPSVVGVSRPPRAAGRGKRRGRPRSPAPAFTRPKA